MLKNIKNIISGKEFLFFELFLIIVMISAMFMFLKSVSAVLYKSEEKHIAESIDYVSSLYEGYTSVAEQNVAALSKSPYILTVIKDQSPANRSAATQAMTEFKNSLNVLEAVGLYDANGKLIAENQRVNLALKGSISSEDFFSGRKLIKVRLYLLR